MKPLESKTPEQFIADFFTSFTEAVVHSDEQPADLMARYYTRDVVQVADGVRLDWGRLVAHLRPVRRNLTEFSFQVHEALTDGNRIAARFTIHARMRKSGSVSTRVHMFAEFTPDGLMRRARQLTRTLDQVEPQHEHGS
ncbi:nuclear transport factor 2 family protein [Streptomyces sp. NPDC050164]|uniref:nuclear transport factor 2 family protein n=1 Tax=Streptomyces sp. NPDC050164 TaxID=3365605 RepID=UPI0037A35862